MSATDTPKQARSHLSSERINELLELARLGSTGATRELYSHYAGFVYQICKRFFLPGGEEEDLFQEGFAGLHHAIRTFAPERGREFDDYASMCVRNQVIRAVRQATRKKHMLLTQAGSIDATEHWAEKTSASPEEQVISSLSVDGWMRLVASCLSQLEREVIVSRLQGESRDEVTARLGIDRKQVENALFRARRKLTEAAQHSALRPAL